MDSVWCRERPKPWEKAKMERQKDLFWFKVEENAMEACKNVDEASVTIVPGPPGDTCKVDNERFCFCGKKGKAATQNWKYICGTCHQNKPFSFKIERPDDPHMLKLNGEKAKENLDKLQKPLKLKNDG